MTTLTVERINALHYVCLSNVSGSTILNVFNTEDQASEYVDKVARILDVKATVT